MLSVVLRDGGCGPACRDILKDLPEWFGIAASNEQYIRDAETRPTWLASEAEMVHGLMILTVKSPDVIEIHFLAVRRDRRRSGVGRALIQTALRTARDSGAKFLTVKTLGPSAESAEYEETRAFYLAQGFVALDEIPTIWGPENPCLFMVRIV